MGPPRALGEAFDPRPVGIDDQRRSRLQGSDRFGGEAEIEQRHALAGGSDQRTLDGILHRPDAEGIAGNDHPPAGIDHRDIPGAVEAPGNRREELHGCRDRVPRELAADSVEDDLGVVVTGEVVVAVGEDLGTQFGVIRQLPIEAEGEPLPLLDVGTLEGLGIAPILGAARRIPDMPDRRRAGVLIHEPLVDAAVAHPEHLAHAPDILVGGEELVAVGIPGRHSGGELPAILDVEKHPGNEPGHVVGPLHRAERTRRDIGEVIDRRKAALVMEFSHHIACMQAPERVPNTGQRPASGRAPMATPTSAIESTLQHRTGGAQSPPPVPRRGWKNPRGRRWDGPRRERLESVFLRLVG